VRTISKSIQKFEIIVTDNGYRSSIWETKAYLDSMSVFTMRLEPMKVTLIFLQNFGKEKELFCLFWYVNSPNKINLVVNEYN